MLAGPSAPEQSSETSCYTRSEILMGCLLKDAAGERVLEIAKFLWEGQKQRWWKMLTEDLEWDYEEK